jgi:hypothetical protein
MKIKSIIALVTAIIFGALSGCVALVMKNTVDSLYHENAAKRFSEGEEYAQFTVFLPESEKFTVDKVMYLRYKLEKALTDNSMEAASGARLYADAYSAYKDITLESEASRSVSAKAVYIGGDYSMFRKELEYAPDITEELNHDRILMSENAAWSLFGGYDLYGFGVSDGSNNFYISGVYSEEDSDENSAFYGNKVPCIIDMAKYPDMSISCYELIMVNPVKNFAKDVLVRALELNEGKYLLVENSERFSVGNLYNKASTILKADERLPEGIVLNPEEMTARKKEKELSVMLILLTILVVYPVIYLLIQLFRLIRLIKGVSDKHIIGRIKNKFSYS